MSSFGDPRLVLSTQLPKHPFFSPEVYLVWMGGGDSGVEVRGGSKGVGMSHVCGGGEFDLREYMGPIRGHDGSEELFVMCHTLYAD